MELYRMIESLCLGKKHMDGSIPTGDHGLDAQLEMIRISVAWGVGPPFFWVLGCNSSIQSIPGSSQPFPAAA